MSNPPPKALLRFLKPYDPQIRDLALAVRSAVLDELAPCEESIYDAYNAVALGYSPTGRFKDGICHVAVYAKHVNLGFNRGAEMDDPDKILTGTGKHIRHITIKTPADLAKPRISTYLRRARKLAGLGPPSPATRLDVISTVKGDYPTKRRPSRSAGV